MKFFFIRELKHQPQRRYTPFANNCFSLRSTPQSMPPHARAEKHLVLRITTATRKKTKTIYMRNNRSARLLDEFEANIRRFAETIQSLRTQIQKIPFRKRSLKDI